MEIGSIPAVSWAARLSQSAKDDTDSTVKKNTEGNDASEASKILLNGSEEIADANVTSKKEGGIHTLVIDSNAIIKGIRLDNLKAEEVVTITEVLNEVKDKNARQLLTTLPFVLKTEEPSEEALNTVMRFSRATGDLHSLSATDVKLLALVYTLEAQKYGTDHLRKQPLPPQIQTKSKYKGKDPPGWGNTANPEEWGEVDKYGDDGYLLERKSSSVSSELKVHSRVLGVQPLFGEDVEIDENEDGTEKEETSTFSHVIDKEVDHQVIQEKGESKPSATESDSNIFGKSVHSGERIRESIFEGKKNVAVGVDASKLEGENSGELGENKVDSSGEWVKPRSRSTRRKHLRRELAKAARESESKDPEPLGDVEEEIREEMEGEGVLEEEDEGKEPEGTWLEDGQEGELEGGDREHGGEESGIERNNSNKIRESPVESSVACLTSDFAMQNVLLQMGLRLITFEGFRVKELHRWALRCVACFTVTMEPGKLFCPKCGNGGTLTKVSITVGENGAFQAGIPKRFNLRGSKFSLPLPLGGREGAQKNPILREDQLTKGPRKKKGPNATDVFSPDFNTWFHGVDSKSHATNHGTNNSLLFRGKRNPNERVARKR